MIYTSSVMNALYTQISSAQTVVDSGIHVELNSLLNHDPNQMPWVGLYHGNITIEPRRLQKPNPWEYVYTPSIVVLEGNFDFNETGREASNRLDETLDIVFTSINSIRTFVNCVYMMTGFEVIPFRFDIDEDSPIYGYEMTLNITKRTV